MILIGFLWRGIYAKGPFIGSEIAFEKRNDLANNCQQVFMNEELIILEDCKPTETSFYNLIS